MYKLLIFCALISLGGCTISDKSQERALATTRFCDSVSTYNIIVKNTSFETIKALYLVYVDINRNKVIDKGDKMFYRSPILTLTGYEGKVMEPIPIDTLWKRYTLITELQTTQGDMIKDHVYPCERDVAK